MVLNRFLVQRNRHLCWNNMELNCVLFSDSIHMEAYTRALWVTKYLLTVPSEIPFMSMVRTSLY